MATYEPVSYMVGIASLTAANGETLQATLSTDYWDLAFMYGTALISGAVVPSAAVAAWYLSAADSASMADVDPTSTTYADVNGRYGITLATETGKNIFIKCYRNDLPV